MEVGLEILASDTHGRYIATQGLAVNNVLLREDMDNLLAGG